MPGVLHIYEVGCPFCGAPQGELCWYLGRSILKPHEQRWLELWREVDRRNRPA